MAVSARPRRLIAEAAARLPERLAAGSACAVRFDEAGAADGRGGRRPPRLVDAVGRSGRGRQRHRRRRRGRRPSGRARPALAYAAALRITRFHTQNDHGDWDEVHHAFTAANALHQALRRSPSTALLRGVYHGALRIYLDRFLNIPAARLPNPGGPGHLDDLQACWDREGHVDDAGAIVYRHLMGGGDPAPVVALLGRALLTEDAEFHWYQTYEAAVQQYHAWPRGSKEGALILTGTARFLAAHTPTRRELSQVVGIATRLRRGEVLFET